MSSDIVVTTDLSDRSYAVLPHAAAFAGAVGASLTLAHILDPSSVKVAPGRPHHRDVDDRVREVKQELEGVLDGRGVEAEVDVVLLRKGETVPGAILRVADELSAAGIAMATRGAGLVRRALFGSVAMGVVGCTVRPVICVGPKSRKRPRRGTYRILASSDLSLASEDVLRQLRERFPATKALIDLVSIYQPTIDDGGDEQEMSSLENSLLELRRRIRLDTDSQVRVIKQGTLRSVAGEIIDEADRRGAAAIAMSTHGHSAAHEILTGSVALGVLRRSPLPVILARKHPADFCA